MVCNERERIGEYSRMNLYTPNDVKQMLERYHVKDGDGPCGPACLAVIERRDIGAVLEDWRTFFGEYRGWALWKELRQYLERKGWKVKQCRFKGFIDPTPERFVICRVQWEGPNTDKNKFYGWGHWAEASSHTHFIVVQDHDVFCSESGWFCLSKLNDYLDGKPGQAKGQVTSYMEIHKLGEDFS